MQKCCIYFVHIFLVLVIRTSIPLFPSERTPVNISTRCFLCPLFLFGYYRFFLSISANSHLPVSCTFHRNFQLFQFRTRWTAGAWSLVKKCNRQSCSESLDLSTLPCAEFVDDATMTFYLNLSEKSHFSVNFATAGETCSSDDVLWCSKIYCSVVKTEQLSFLPESSFSQLEPGGRRED